jgi:hypothetical protein
VRTLVILIVSAAVVVAGAATAAADSKVPRVGIVVGVTVNVEPEVADGVGAALAAALVKKLKVDAIGGDEVTRRLPPGGLPDECVSTRACIADLGKRLAADQLLFLGVIRVGTEYQVDATFVDVASGQQAARPRVKVTDPDKAAEQFEAEATRFLPDAEVRTSTNQTVIVHAEGERHRPIKPVVWVLAGTSLAALGTGIALGLSAKSKFDACDKPTGPFCTDDQKSKIRSRALFADISLGVGVGAAVAAIVLYFKTPVEILGVTPSVSPVEGGGVVVSFDGRF